MFLKVIDPVAVAELKAIEDAKAAEAAEAKTIVDENVNNAVKAGTTE